MEPARPQAPAHLAASRAGQDLAEIAPIVGNRSAKVLADTYTHVLIDERELDYTALIAERVKAQGASQEPVDG